MDATSAKTVKLKNYRDDASLTNATYRKELLRVQKHLVEAFEMVKARLARAVAKMNEWSAVSTKHEPH